MKRMRRELFILLLTGMILSQAAADGNQYVQLFQRVDYGSAAVYVIGHKSPDPDSIGSAIALAELLNAIGIQAVPAASERIDNESATRSGLLAWNRPGSWMTRRESSLSWWITVSMRTRSIIWTGRASQAFWIIMGSGMSKARN